MEQEHSAFKLRDRHPTHCGNMVINEKLLRVNQYLRLNFYFSNYYLFTMTTGRLGVSKTSYDI